MSVIIRLQNLPWAANAADIRQYFQGLSIPEGGVHIVGGEKGDAFISFSTDEDARQAMQVDGGCIKEVQIRLLLSSRNEMQKVIETARQQSLQLSQVYMQQMQQPQIPIIGPLPPLTAKVLPLPQQQVRPDRPINILRRHQPIMDPSTVIMIQEKQQQHLLSPRSSENKDRGDDKNHKRERTRSKSRDRRSKSSRSGGGSRRDRSRSRDRRRRDRSRGRDRSRDRHRGGGSSSRGGGGKSHRSRSPSNKSMDSVKAMVGDQQTSIRPWTCQYDNIQQQMGTDNHQSTSVMNIGGGPPGSMFTQFRTPPQPPIIPILNPNPFQQQQQLLQKPPNSEWTAIGGDERQQQPYVPDNNFRGNDYDEGSDDEDDRQSKFGNNFHKRFNDTSSAPVMRKFPVQGFRDQQGFGPNNKGPRFNKPPQGIGAQNMRSGGHRPLNDFAGSGGPRFNNHQQQQPRYGDGSGGNLGNPQNSVVRQSRFSSIQESGRPSRFNPMPQIKNDVASDPNFDDDSKKLPPRYNDRYRYDVRNTQPPIQSEGLCVEVNNMSNHFSYGDIRKVFEGIHIDGSAIKIQKHRQGVAFVRFDNNHNKNLALRVNGTEYKGSRIVIKHLDDGAYERENTDNRPYPSTVAAPTIVDHVDLVDDDDDDEQLITDDNKRNNKQEDDDHSDDNCNLVVCEMNVKDGGKTECGGSDEQQSSTTSQQEQPTKYLKLKQLPITVTEQDVLNEIDGGGDVRRVIFYPDGEFQGVVLEFQSVDAAEATLKRFDCVLLGSTPVPVLRCTYNEYTLIKRKTGGGGRRFTSSDTGGRHHHHHHHNQHHPPSSSRSPPTASLQPPPPPSLLPVLRSNCVYVYGLPTTVTNTDITQFFADTSTLPDKIHIMLSKFARPTGESYCEFSTAQQAHAALAKDQCFMGPNMVYVELIGRSEMIQAITKPMQQHNHHQDISWGGGMRGGGGSNGGSSRPQQHMMTTPRNHQGPPPQQSSFGGHNGPYGNGPQHQFMNNGGGRGVGYTPRIRGPGPGPNTGPDGFGQPGCVVALDNVPYRADVQEIVDFFEGFELNTQNVIRRFNDFGKPTGEARVNLRTPQEAMRAVRVLQNKPIYNRPVRLTLL